MTVRSKSGALLSTPFLADLSDRDALELAVVLPAAELPAVAVAEVSPTSPAAFDFSLFPSGPALRATSVPTPDPGFVSVAEAAELPAVGSLPAVDASVLAPSGPVAAGWLPGWLDWPIVLWLVSSRC